MQRDWTTDSDGFVAVNGEIPLPSNPATRAQVDKIIEQWGSVFQDQTDRTGVPWHWLVGFCEAESAGNQRAQSPAGAMGLMQIMPFNFPQYFGRRASQEEMLTGEISAAVAANMIAAMRAHGADLPTAASMYNAGAASASGARWEPKRCGRGYPCADTSWGPDAAAAMYAESTYITQVVEAANYALRRRPASGLRLLPVLLAAAAGWGAYWGWSKYLAPRYFR